MNLATDSVQNKSQQMLKHRYFILSETKKCIKMSSKTRGGRSDDEGACDWLMTLLPLSDWSRLAARVT